MSPHPTWKITTATAPTAAATWTKQETEGEATYFFWKNACTEGAEGVVGGDGIVKCNVGFSWARCLLWTAGILGPSWKQNRAPMVFVLLWLADAPRSTKQLCKCFPVVKLTSSCITRTHSGTLRLGLMDWIAVHSKNSAHLGRRLEESLLSLLRFFLGGKTRTDANNTSAETHSTWNLDKKKSIQHKTNSPYACLDGPSSTLGTHLSLLFFSFLSSQGVSTWLKCDDEVSFQ